MNAGIEGNKERRRAMYKFIDVNEASSGDALPAEALNINGEYIENMVQGYRTLSTKGREALASELDYYEMKARDGAVNKSKRYPPRIITVRYQLLAKSAEEYRESYNMLGYILSANEATLIFNDEKDKFYIGTVTEIGEVEEGRNCVVGEFEIFCADPFKYSVTEYEAFGNQNSNTILVDYGGTYKSFPKLCVDFHEENDNETSLSTNGECGFVAFFNENEKIIQLGNPNELDSSYIPPSTTTLVNSVFSNHDSYGATAQAKWKQNIGVTTGSDVVQTGVAGMGTSSYDAPAINRDTYGILLENKATTSGDIIFYYTVKARATNRTEKTADISIAITVKLKEATAIFGSSNALKAKIMIGGVWQEVYLKKTEEIWYGNTGYTINATFSIGNLSSEATTLSGIKFKVERTDKPGDESGVLPETVCSGMVINAYKSYAPSRYYLTSKEFGTGTYWHGASVTRTIQNAVNCKLLYSNTFAIGSGWDGASQVGVFQALLVGGKQIIAGVSIVKGGYGSNATIYFFVKGAVAYKTDVDVAHGNFWFNDRTATLIDKNGAEITFTVNGICKKFTDQSITDTGVDSITFLFGQHAQQPVLTDNGLHYAKVIKDVKEATIDIKNVFTPNDKVIADCESGNIYRNGILEQGLGALGNDWEDFYLKQGINQIGTAYSSFVKQGYEPKFKVKYREVFL